MVELMERQKESIFGRYLQVSKKVSAFQVGQIIKDALANPS
jgi:hypothetical protein